VERKESRERLSWFLNGTSQRVMYTALLALMRGGAAVGAVVPPTPPAPTFHYHEPAPKAVPGTAYGDGSARNTAASRAAVSAANAAQTQSRSPPRPGEWKSTANLSKDRQRLRQHVLSDSDDD
jgi:hypothetical protein